MAQRHEKQHTMATRLRHHHYYLTLTTISMRTCRRLLIATILLIIVFYFLSHSRSELHRLRQENARLRRQQFVATTNPSQQLCSTIHVSVVCAGRSSTRRLVTLLKSILFHRTKNPLHFHFLVDRISREQLQTLMPSWRLPNLTYTLYSIDDADVAWIPNRHYSGVYGLLKLTLTKVLRDLERVVVVDTDVLFAADIGELWALFEQFDERQAIGLVENQSDWYLGTLHERPWPARGRGFNTGVMLLELERMRKQDWNALWRLIAERYLARYERVVLADQDVFNAVLLHHDEWLYVVPCVWNVQLGENSKSAELCERQDLKVIHWNRPNKDGIAVGRHGEFAQQLFQMFVEFDGHLLRPIWRCGNFSASSNPSKSTEPSKSSSSNDDACHEFRHAMHTRYRTHLYYLDYYQAAAESDVVTLAAQLSIDRLQMLEPICERWSGPISVALYMTDAEAWQLLNYVRNSAVLSSRHDIAYHIVYRDGSLYPVNFLRNVALDAVKTPYAFLSDIDFLPMPSLYPTVCKWIRTITTTAEEQQQLALVVPAFETQRYKLKFPTNKSDLLELLASGDVLPFRQDVWPRGHAPTNYSRWRDAGGDKSSYRVQWQPDYEPYVVVRAAAVPRYDRRFLGFGWNKVSHSMELAVRGYEFRVVPDAFIVHMPHAPSFEIARYRANRSYRLCLGMLKQEFIRHLAKRYGRRATRYLQAASDALYDGQDALSVFSALGGQMVR